MILLKMFRLKPSQEPYPVQIVLRLLVIHLQCLDIIQKPIEMWLPHLLEGVVGDVQADDYAEKVLSVPPFHDPSPLFIESFGCLFGWMVSSIIGSTVL
jgi:hypothetical protein